MFDFSNAHHFRKTVAGLCMMVAPMMLLAGVVIHPERHTDAAAQLRVVAANLDAWYLSHLLILMSVVLLVPAVLGLMHMLRERQVAWGHVGGGLAMLGLLAVTMLVAVDGFVAWQAAAANSPEMTALFERLNGAAGFVIPVYIVALLFAVGTAVLAMGLMRARATQSWHALSIAAGAVLMTIGGMTAGVVFDVAGAGLLLAGFGSVGRVVLAETDSEWEHTPEVKDFRALPGMH